MDRNQQLVCIQALWEAGNTFPVGGETRKLYHALSEQIEAKLKPKIGEVDEALAKLSDALKAKA